MKGARAMLLKWAPALFLFWVFGIFILVAAEESMPGLHLGTVFVIVVDNNQPITNLTVTVGERSSEIGTVLPHKPYTFIPYIEGREPPCHLTFLDVKGERHEQVFSLYLNSAFPQEVTFTINAQCDIATSCGAPPVLRLIGKILGKSDEK
jgi:hypothetical protein